jgi:hypothetical protein
MTLNPQYPNSLKFFVVFWQGSVLTVEMLSSLGFSLFQGLERSAQLLSDQQWQEQLAWFDEKGDRYLTAAERAELKR